MDLKEHLKNVKTQQEQAKELFLKCQGAVELLEGLIKEQESSENNKKDVKEVKKNVK
jgi:hypothetical protein